MAEGKVDEIGMGILEEKGEGLEEVLMVGDEEVNDPEDLQPPNPPYCLCPDKLTL